MSKSILPDDGIVVSKKWLEETYPMAARQIIRYASQPLKPVLEVAYDEGFKVGNNGYASIKETVWTEFLNNPIEIR